jgi:hypothetical protein
MIVHMKFEYDEGPEAKDLFESSPDLFESSPTSLFRAPKSTAKQAGKPARKT